VLDRNLLPALVPLMLVVAAGLGAWRSRPLGAAVTVGLCAVSVLVVIRVAGSPDLQRNDYRAAAKLIRAGTSAAVVAPRNAGSSLGLYLGVDHYADHPLVDEVVVVGWWEPAHVSRSFAGFELTERREVAGLNVTRLRSSRPRRLRPPALARLEPRAVSLLLYEAPPPTDVRHR
jgi:hypothetical protein